MKKVAQIAPIAALAALALLNTNRIALGTHAPRQATQVWRVATKAGDTASAVPVALKPGTTDVVIFLTARHVSGDLGAGAIVESMDKMRKLPIVHHIEHPKEDIGILHVKLAADAKPIKLVRIAPDVELEPGLSVFAVGYPGSWFVARGYLCSFRFMSATVYYGMSGGAVLLNDGRLVGVIEGFGYATDDRPTMVWDGPPGPGAKSVGGFYAKRDRNSKGAYTALALVKPWLKTHHVIPAE